MDRRLLDVMFLSLIIGPIAYLEFMTAAYAGAFEPESPSSLVGDSAAGGGACAIEDRYADA